MRADISKCLFDCSPNTTEPITNASPRFFDARPSTSKDGREPSLYSAESGLDIKPQILKPALNTCPSIFDTSPSISENILKPVFCLELIFDSYLIKVFGIDFGTSTIKIYRNYGRWK